MFFKVRSFENNFILNLFASIILIGTMHLWVYPKLAMYYGVEKYGFILATMAGLTIVYGTLGNGLNNLRMITNKDYNDRELRGDYNIILLLAFIAAFIVVVILYFFDYLAVERVTILGILGIVILAVFRMYATVEYRLHLDYKRVLFLNILMSIGYILSVLLVVNQSSRNNAWIFIFLSGEICACIYLLLTTSLWKEPFTRTYFFSKTIFKYGGICYLSLVDGALLYLDRTFLYPLLGGTAVAIFFVSTILGKVMGIVAGPAANVLFSYLGQQDFVITRKKYKSLLWKICFFGIFCYLGAILLSGIIVSFLYPEMYGEVTKIMFISNVVPVTGVIGTMILPVVLRYVSLSRQSIFETGYLLFYMIVCYFFSKQYGLLGFCYGAIVSNMVRIVYLWYLGYYAIRNIEGR